MCLIKPHNVWVNYIIFLDKNDVGIYFINDFLIDIAVKAKKPLR